MWRTRRCWQRATRRGLGCDRYTQSAFRVDRERRLQRVLKKTLCGQQDPVAGFAVRDEQGAALGSEGFACADRDGARERVHIPPLIEGCQQGLDRQAWPAERRAEPPVFSCFASPGRTYPRRASGSGSRGGAKQEKAGG